MTLTLQEISDRMEIQDLLYRYAEVIDGKRFDELYEVFAEDAHIDYSVFGGSVGDRDHTIAFLKKAMPMFPNTQHSNANAQIKVDGDHATGRVMCFNRRRSRCRAAALRCSCSGCGTSTSTCAHPRAGGSGGASRRRAGCSTHPSS